jgi:membrane-anchored protein YejM (alkaline phosphatase superfamily)
MNQGTGIYLLVIGFTFVIAGALIYFFHDKLHWIGHLPGDIIIKKENFSLYFPITTMLVFSAFFTLALYLLRKLL